MKVSIIESRCQGHARCAHFAPEIFIINDEGYASVNPEFATVPVELREKARKACGNCPEKAIELRE